MIQNLICGVYLLLSDLPAENLKVNKNQRKRSFILQCSLTRLTNLEPRKIVKYILPSTTKNLNHFTNFPANMFLVDVRKNICTAPFLDAQELHSRSTWKANVCTFLYISVRKFFSVRNFSLVGGMGLNNFLEAAHCLSLKKRFKMFNFN